MRTEYLIVLGAILLFPLVLSFIMPLKLYARWRAMVLSMGLVCIPYWTWDAIVTARGHWSFNPSYVLGITFLGMPVEEWLFFIVITFVSIFTYEAVRFVVGRRTRQ
jgi:lycopene cyclase domain-containing protein